MHIVLTISNNSVVPYFSWFADKSLKHPEVKLSFVIMYRQQPAMIEEMVQKNIDAYWIPYDDKNRKRGMILAFFRLYKLFKKTKPDIVHTHLFDDSLPALMAAKLAGVKSRIITKQDTSYHWFYAPKAVKYDRLNNSLATRIVAVSAECRNFILEKEKADPEKITLIHHGINQQELSLRNTAQMDELRDRFKLKDKRVVGTIARLIDWKGYRLIIEAVSIVVAELPDTVFLFVGTGPQEQELINLVVQKGLQANVIFAGWIEKENIPSLYAVMDVYLHAAKYEPFGFVIAEAMFNKVPIVSTRTGAAADAIDHLNSGYLVDELTADGLAKGVIYLLKNKALAKDMAEKAYRKAEGMYTIDKMWEGYLNLYKELLLNN